MAENNGYQYSIAWFDFSFANQGKVSPTHTALFMWFIELNNRMGWADNFASPASSAMSAIGVKSYASYKKAFDDLVNFGFIKVVVASKNQYQACIIALSKNNKALNKANSKALDKAIANHTECFNERFEEKQQSTIESIVQSTIESKCNINKPQTINLKQVVTVDDVVTDAAENFEEKISEEKKFEYIPDESYIDEEEYSAAVEVLKKNILFMHIQQKNRKSEKETLDLFRVFYEQKTGFSELKGKTAIDVIKNFFYWVPKYLVSESKTAPNQAQTSKIETQVRQAQERRAARQNIN